MSSSPDFESTRNIESALGELFHRPTPDPAFVDRLERRILRLERTEDHGARILQKIRRGFSSTGRSLAWMAGAVLLVVFIGWSVRRLIPAGDPLTPFPDTTISPTTGPTTTPLPVVEKNQASLGKLAYVQGSRLWVKDLPDGQPVEWRGPQDSGDISRPRWSPSGNWLAYRKGEDQLVIAGQNGVIFTSGPVIDFAWSPAADLLVFIDGESSLINYEPSGSPQEQLLLYTPENGRITQLAWSPDGEWIAFRQEGDREGMAIGELWKISVYGGDPVRLATPEEGVYRIAGWSPDGAHLAFWMGGPSASLAADGLALATVSSHGGLPVRLAEAGLAYDGFFSAGPFGADLMAASIGGGRETWHNKRILVFTAGNTAHVSSLEQAAISPAWSPDGAQLAYSAMPNEEGDLAGGEPLRQALMERRIWIWDAANGQARQITGDPDYRDERPLWSRDGQSLLVARLDSSGNAGLALVPLEGGETVQVLEPSPATGWLREQSLYGYYGYIEWGDLYDWWQVSSPLTPLDIPPPQPTSTPTALPPSSLEDDGQPYEVVFTIENEAPFSGRVGDPKPDWLGWGAQAFTVAPDGTFWIGDSAAEPPRLLHYSASGELLGAVPLDGQVVGLAGIAVDDSNIWVAGQASQPPRVVRYHADGEFAAGYDLPDELGILVSGLSISEEGGPLLSVMGGQAYYRLLDSEGNASLQQLDGFIAGGRLYRLGISSDRRSGTIFAGEAQAEIRAQGLVGELSILGAAPDGSFYVFLFDMEDGPVIKGESILYHFDSEGNLLGAAPRPESHIYVDSNRDLAVGPDGALYALLSQEDHSVQVVRVRFGQNLTPAPAPTPAPDDMPDLSKMDLEATVSNSPDGLWEAECLIARPNNPKTGEVSGRQEYTLVIVSRTDGSLTWAPKISSYFSGSLESLPVTFYWSADGKYLYFHPSEIFSGAHRDLWLERVSLADRGVETIDLPGKSNRGRQSLSPDASVAAYTGEERIYLLDLASGEAQSVSYGISMENIEGFGRPIWSPDGQALLLTLYGPSHDNTNTLLLVKLNPLRTEVLFERDPRGLDMRAWAGPERVEVYDKEFRRWQLDLETRELSPAPEDDLLKARQALGGYFYNLWLGDYETAAGLYGGGYEALSDVNPGVDPEDKAGLLKNACDFNGFQCLKLRQVVAAEAISPAEYRFTVEFLNNDGSRFRLGPCCGANEAEMPPVWRFDYTVKKYGEGWVVLELPPYVP